MHPHSCLKSLEETNRSFEEEIGELRQLQDAAAEAGDIREMQRELRVSLLESVTRCSRMPAGQLHVTTHYTGTCEPDHSSC